MTTMTTAELDEIKPVTEYLRTVPDGLRRDVFHELADKLPVHVFTRVKYEWPLWARDEQLPPDDLPGDPWHIWLLLAGRGFGKTRVGAEWVRARAESGQSRRIALIARTPHEAETVMVNGESGILAVCPPWNRPNWEPTKRRLTWPNGAMAFVFSSYEPDQLRGPQFDAAWCDELASWQYPQLTWDNLAFGLRLGPSPKCVVTTTPKPIDIVRELAKRKDVILTTGSSYDNSRNLPTGYIQAIRRRYEGTTAGQQEIHAQLLKEADGALWKREWIDDHRMDSVPDDIYRTTVAIDPAVTFNPRRSDETGIIVAGIAGDYQVPQHEKRYYILEDASGIMTPDAWARRVVQLAQKYDADFITGETNQGGSLIESVIKHAAGGEYIRFKGVHATQSKRARAEPAAAIYEQGRAHHVGRFTELEDQMCAWTPDSPNSPDRMDSLVWAINGLAEHARTGVFLWV